MRSQNREREPDYQERLLTRFESAGRDLLAGLALFAVFILAMAIGFHEPIQARTPTQSMSTIATAALAVPCMENRTSQGREIDRYPRSRIGVSDASGKIEDT